MRNRWSTCACAGVACGWGYSRRTGSPRGLPNPFSGSSPGVETHCDRRSGAADAGAAGTFFCRRQKGSQSASSRQGVEETRGARLQQRTAMCQLAPSPRISSTGRSMPYTPPKVPSCHSHRPVPVPVPLPLARPCRRFRLPGTAQPAPCRSRRRAIPRPPPLPPACRNFPRVHSRQQAPPLPRGTRWRFGGSARRQVRHVGARFPDERLRRRAGSRAVPRRRKRRRWKAAARHPPTVAAGGQRRLLAGTWQEGSRHSRLVYKCIPLGFRGPREGQRNLMSAKHSSRARLGSETACAARDFRV